LEDLCSTFDVTAVYLAKNDMDAKIENSKRWTACGQKFARGGMTVETKTEVVERVKRLPASDQAQDAVHPKPENRTRAVRQSCLARVA